MGLSRQAVYNYLKMEQPPERTRINQQRKPLIEPYKEYLIKRWNEGCRNAQLVYRELKEQGYTGSDQPVQRYFVQFRKKKDGGNSSKLTLPMKLLSKRPPSVPQRLRRWLIGSPLKKINAWNGNRST